MAKTTTLTRLKNLNRDIGVAVDEGDYFRALSLSHAQNNLIKSHISERTAALPCLSNTRTVRPTGKL